MAGRRGRASYPDKGQEGNSLPYRLQDDYDRVRRPRVFKTAVLENEILRATFLLELGGRLWSLVHKPSGRELLHVNPVFQPCNLGAAQRLVQRRSGMERRDLRAFAAIPVRRFSRRG